jgi:hypothetical protein
MSDSALFVGWGQPVRGREKRAMAVFEEAAVYYAGLQQAGTITSFEPVLLDPHGGDLQGFFLVKGPSASITEVVNSEEFIRLNVRAGMIVENLGIIRAYTGDEVVTQLGHFGDAADEFG